jgi:hypothetical protein
MVFFAGHPTSPDNAHAFAWARYIVDRGNVDATTEWRAKANRFGVGRTLLHIPFILLARGITAVTGQTCEGPVSMLPYALNGGLGIALCYLILCRNGVASRAAWQRSAVIGLASIWFPYTKLDDVEPLVTTLLLAMWLLAERRPLLAGFVGGLAATLRPDGIFWVAVTGLCCPVPFSSKVRMALTALSGVAIAVGGNWFRREWLTEAGYNWLTGYHSDSEAGAGALIPIYIGLYGIFLSPGKGVAFFSPLLLLWVPSLKDSLSRPQTRALARWSIALFAAETLFLANLCHWASDDAWGIRYLIPAVMVAHLALASSSWARGKLYWGFAALGLVIQLAAVLIGPLACQLLVQEREEEGMAWKAEFHHEDRYTPITVRDMRYDPRYCALTGTFELLQIKLTGRVPHSSYPKYQGTYLSESLTPPPSPETIDWDIFWLNFRKYQSLAAQRRAGQVPASPGAQAGPAPPFPDPNRPAHRWVP